MKAVNEYYESCKQFHEEIKRMISYLDKLREKANKELDKVGQSL